MASTTQEILAKLKECVLKGDDQGAVVAANEAVAVKLDPNQAIMDGLVAGMGEAGALYEQGEYYVSELMVSSEALYAGLAILQPLVVGQGRSSKKGVAVIGAVQGDVHDIGKNLVKLMLQVAGFEVHDLGRDVDMDRFIEEGQRLQADLICMSALMTTTMIAIKDTLPALRAKLPKAKVLIGGAPLNQKLADDWGADGYGENAMEAARVAERLMAAAR
jgi:corrinoid protein of di/trimethylamine methyltransferase